MKMIFSSGAVKVGTSGGIVWMPSGEPKVTRREKVEPVLQPNIMTTPAKRGGGGILTPGVLFGWDEERKFPEHVPDDYNIAYLVYIAVFQTTTI